MNLNDLIRKELLLSRLETYMNAITGYNCLLLMLCRVRARAVETNESRKQQEENKTAAFSQVSMFFLTSHI